MSNDKEIKIEFAPGAFDSFEGTQEELDDLIAEIQNMFANKSKEELEAMSRPLSDEELAELPDHLLANLVEDEDLAAEFKRKLQ